MKIKESVVLIFMCCLIAFSGVNFVSAGHYKDIKDNSLFFDATSNYAMNIDVKFYDAEKNEITALRENKGHCSKDVTIEDLDKKIENGAVYMSIYTKVYGKGSRQLSLEYLPVIPGSFNYLGLAGSTAHVDYQFSNGIKGSFAFY